MLPFNRPIIVFLFLIVLAIIGLRQCPFEKPEVVQKSQIIMDTVVQITAFGEEGSRTTAAVNAAFGEMKRIEALTSFYMEGSDLQRLAVAGSAEVSPEVAGIISLGLEVARASGGAFDMTLGNLKSLWGIETDQPRVPGVEEIREALKGTGPDALKVDGLRVEKKSAATTVDLGGIAKGFAIDRAVDILAGNGIKHAAVNAGGDIRLLGDRKGKPWRIAIQDPRHSSRFAAKLFLKDVAVVTSGDYERFFEKDGVRYHHLFDPRTGYPSQASRSVTVLAENATLADALATAAFVLGPEKGLDLLKKFPSAAGLIIGADGKNHTTPGFDKVVEWQ
ncbi:MAG: FAD:protein FMN transferase [Deltaproteobacteria bacterium]|nr:FAD:protein FMN transferase [Deltaproteobacteria bacterium]